MNSRKTRGCVPMKVTLKKLCLILTLLVPRVAVAQTANATINGGQFQTVIFPAYSVTGDGSGNFTCNFATSNTCLVTQGTRISGEPHTDKPSHQPVRLLRDGHKKLVHDQLAVKRILQLW